MHGVRQIKTQQPNRTWHFLWGSTSLPGTQVWERRCPLVWSWHPHSLPAVTPRRPSSHRARVFESIRADVPICPSRRKAPGAHELWTLASKIYSHQPVTFPLRWDQAVVGPDEERVRLYLSSCSWLQTYNPPSGYKTSRAVLTVVTAISSGLENASCCCQYLSLGWPYLPFGGRLTCHLLQGMSPDAPDGGRIPGEGL